MPEAGFMVKSAPAEAPMGQVPEVIVNNDGSKQNVLRYCWNHGQEILNSYASGSEFHLLVRGVRRGRLAPAAPDGSNPE